MYLSGATEDAINAAREAFHLHLAASQKGQQHVQDTSEEDLSQLDERELDAEFVGQHNPSFFFSLVIVGLHNWVESTECGVHMALRVLYHV